MNVTIENIEKVLKSIYFPGTNKNIHEFCLIENIQLQDKKLSCNLIFNRPNDPNIIPVKKVIQESLEKIFPEKLDVKGNINILIRKNEDKIFPLVKHIIAIASGKGGVGKSTIAANLAVSLAKMNYKVGLIDADIFGPSIPKMFALEDTKAKMVKIGNKNLIEPSVKYGVKILSIGFFINPTKAMVWRGPMASNAFKQIMEDGNWGSLDFILIDLPPGTSDIHLTLAQSVSLTGAIIVTTPQEVALADATKSIDMFSQEKIEVPVLGIIENMSWFTPKELPNNKYYLFGKDGGKNLAKSLNLPLLGHIPIIKSICDSGDNGIPTALNESNLENEYFSHLIKKILEIIKVLKR